MRAPGVAIAALVLATVAGAASASDAAPATAQAARDWSTVVVVTPEGGYRMGNPDAKARIVEYGSLTCGHCADFANEAMAPLIANYVRAGTASFEYRNMVLNGIDVSASLVARCAGSDRFFDVADALYKGQATWLAATSALSSAEKARLQALPEAELLLQLAESNGVAALAREHGASDAQLRQCVADPAALERLGTMYDAAAALGVEGTPTFFINGARVKAHTWRELEPLIRSAAG